MLNQSRVLTYIKDNLGHPFQFIEFSDQEIMEYVTTYTLREFSYYIPDVNTCGFNPNLPANKVPTKGNEYYLTDDQNLEILNVKEIFFPIGNSILHGHPPLGPLSLGEMANWALNVEVAGWIKQFSSFDHTYEFKAPNIVRISPRPTETMLWLAIEYERMHPPDFSKIPNDLQMIFCELALADIMIRVGRLRSKYAQSEGIKTPFGDIPLQAGILEEGQTKKDKIIDKLEAKSLPNVIIDIG